ncbi:hypothetical protein RRG08_038422 [Elysia crispata]|uniref:Uncharacterized protein n=1 Tax=Elysia crispata TaxID=231223 RepID=A0AAE1ANH8_9GAST|nr:hypothetical protein RRG08_038422 [Elysia crispata]
MCPLSVKHNAPSAQPSQSSQFISPAGATEKIAIEKRFLASGSSVSDPRGQQCLPPLTRQACRLLAMTCAAPTASGAAALSSPNGDGSCVSHPSHVRLVAYWPCLVPLKELLVLQLCHVQTVVSQSDRYNLHQGHVGERGADTISMSIGSVEFTSHYSELHCASSIILFLTATLVNR